MGETFKNKLPAFSIIIALFIFFLALMYANKIENDEMIFWILRILVALATSVISAFIPGMIKINYNADSDNLIRTNSKGEFDSSIPQKSLTDSQPGIVAGGAIAIFVLVYFFDPLAKMFE